MTVLLADKVHKQEPQRKWLFHITIPTMWQWYGRYTTLFTATYVRMHGCVKRSHLHCGYQ